MASIVVFPQCMGARFYYLKRILRPNRRSPEFELVAEREEASKFDDDEAMLFQNEWGGLVKPVDWKDETPPKPPKSLTAQISFIHEPKK